MERYIAIDERGQAIGRIHCCSLAYAARAVKVLFSPDAMPLEWDRATHVQRHRAKRFLLITQAGAEKLAGKPYPHELAPSWVPGLGTYRKPLVMRAGGGG